MSDVSSLSGISGLSYDYTLLSLVLLPAPMALSVLYFFLLSAGPFSKSSKILCFMFLYVCFM